MNDRDEQPQWLQQALQQLPKEQSPARDLWPDIEQRMSTPQRRFPYAVAASVLIAGASLLFSYQLYQQQQDTALRLAQAEQVLKQIDSPYRYARVSYQDSWPELREQLSADTAQVIEENLQLIHEARAKIEAAIQKEPNNMALQSLLHQSLDQELSVYRKANQVAQQRSLI